MLTFLLGAYVILSSTEYCVHRFVLHAHPNSAPRCLQEWAVMHTLHHYQVQAPAIFDPNTQIRDSGLIFTWAETATLVALVLPSFLLLALLTSTPWMLGVLSAVLMVHVDVGVHNYCHCLGHNTPAPSGLCPSVPVPSGIVAIIHRHHNAHHTHHGKRNFCVALLGADWWCPYMFPPV